MFFRKYLVLSVLFVCSSLLWAGSILLASAGDLEQHLVRRVAPVYPPIAKAARISGDVELDIVITPAGKVETAVANKGPELLRQAAVDAVKQWVFRPFMENGTATYAGGTVVIPFPASEEGRADAATGTEKSPHVYPHTIKISPEVAEGMLEKRVEAIYPPIAKAARIQGVIVVKLVITPSGDVDNVGVVSGPELLRGSALEAVKQWKYKPFLLNGQPTAVETMASVVFMLNTRPKYNPSEEEPK